MGSRGGGTPSSARNLVRQRARKRKAATDSRRRFSVVAEPRGSRALDSDAVVTFSLPPLVGQDFRNSNLGAHLLNLRGLVFYCCRETRNRGFQFRDPLLLLLKFIECRLVLGALRTAYSQLLPTCIDKAGAQVTIGIDVHGEGGASINARPVNAADIRVFVIEFRWRQFRRWKSHSHRRQNRDRRYRHCC